MVHLIYVLSTVYPKKRAQLDMIIIYNLISYMIAYYWKIFTLGLNNDNKTVTGFINVIWVKNLVLDISILTEYFYLNAIKEQVTFINVSFWFNHNHNITNDKCFQRNDKLVACWIFQCWFVNEWETLGKNRSMIQCALLLNWTRPLCRTIRWKL